MRSFYLHARTAPPWLRSIIWVDYATNMIGCMSWNVNPPTYRRNIWYKCNDYGPLLKVKSRL